MIRHRKNAVHLFILKFEGKKNKKKIACQLLHCINSKDSLISFKINLALGFRQCKYWNVYLALKTDLFVTLIPSIAHSFVCCIIFHQEFINHDSISLSCKYEIPNFSHRKETNVFCSTCFNKITKTDYMRYSKMAIYIIQKYSIIYISQILHDLTSQRTKQSDHTRHSKFLNLKCVMFHFFSSFISFFAA